MLARVLLISRPRAAGSIRNLPPFWALKTFFKKRLARHQAVRIMRDLGGGNPPGKDLPERRSCYLTIR